MSIPDKNVLTHFYAQEALAPNETLFRALIENSSDIIVLLTAEGLVSYVSPSITRILGYPAEDVVGCHALVLIHPDDLNLMQQVLASVFQLPRKSQRAEYRLRHRDGSWRWFEGVGTNLLDDPSVGAIVGNFRDITERKQAEEQLLFQADILHNVTESVIVTDLQGSIIYWNEEARRIFGYSPEEMLGKTTATLYPDSDAMYLDQDLEGILAGKDYIGEWLGRRKDGTSVWVDIKTTVLRNSEGAARGFIGIAKDVTERKQLEEDVRQSKQQLEVILHTIADGISVQDAQGDVVYMNDAGATLCGYSSPSDVLVQADFQSLRAYTTQRFEIRDEQGHPFPISELPGSRALRGETSPQAIVQYYDRVSQTRRWSQVKARPILDDDGQVQLAVTIFSDITDTYEAELRKDEFIGMASHELKTPITTLKGTTQLLKRRLEKAGLSESVTALARMETQIDRLTRLVTDLLDVSKIQAGRLDYAVERIALDTFMHDLVETEQQIIPTHTLVMHGAANCSITGDSDRLGQVFLNLINNAVKYSPQADHVDIHITTAQKMALVSVQDYGVGIPKEHLSKIFDRFYRVYDESSKAFPGLGMGLYISHQIVKRHGGDITVISEEGKGSTFTVSLPLEGFAGE